MRAWKFSRTLRVLVMYVLSYYGVSVGLMSIVLTDTIVSPPCSD